MDTKDPFEQERQKSLAYSLNEKLQYATQRFLDKHPKATINAIFGAANVFIASWLCYAPTKEDALKVLDENCKILKNMIEETPDNFFHKKPNIE